MELHQLECFLELSRFQNVTLTAEKLNTSQPAVSRTISLLESELGTKLFDRVDRRIILNEKGKLFAKYVQEAMTSLNMGTDSVQKAEIQPEGVISVGIFSYADFLTDCIRSFRERYPRAEFEIYSSKTQYTIENLNTLDFILTSALSRRRMPKNTQLEHLPIERERYVLAVSRRLLRKHGLESPEERRPLALFHGLPFLVMADNLMFSDVTYRFCEDAGFVPQAVIKTNDYATKLHTTAEGIVAAFIPEVCVPVFRALGEDLVFIRPTDVDTERTVFLGKKKQANSQIAKAFWEFAKEYFPEITQK